MNWLRKLFVRQAAAEDPGTPTNYLVNIAYDETKHDWCARIIAYENRQTRWLRKATLEMLMREVKQEITSHQRALHHDPNAAKAESRIITPPQFRANGS